MNTEDTAMIKQITLATICAEHTRQVQLLFHVFYNGNVSMQEYRKRSRELTQWLVDAIEAAGYTKS